MTLKFSCSICRNSMDSPGVFSSREMIEMRRRTEGKTGSDEKEDSWQSHANT